MDISHDPRCLTAVLVTISDRYTTITIRGRPRVLNAALESARNLCSTMMTALDSWAARWTTKTGGRKPGLGSGRSAHQTGSTTGSASVTTMAKACGSFRFPLGAECRACEKHRPGAVVLFGEKVLERLVPEDPVFSVDQIEG
jgi:hypothetical protein